MRSKIKRVFLVTGTPGVGKTTVSRILATKLKALHVDIANVVTRERLTNGYDEKRETMIADTNKLARRLQDIISKSSRIVIVDGHYATSVVTKDQVTRVFVLRCHPKELGKRMEERGFEGSKLKENLAAEILDVCLIDAVTNVGKEKVCEVDTTGQTFDDTARCLLSIIRGRKMCSVGIVDWLGRLEAEGILEQYLQEF